MGVTQSFKQTTVGAIPQDWRVVPLVQLIRSVEYGSSAKSITEGRVPVLRMGNLQGGRIDWADLVYTDDQDEINKYGLRTGDVLFNRTNTIDLVGKTSIYQDERPAIFAGYLIRINVIQDSLDSRFLNYVLNAEFSRKFSMQVLSVAVGQANINGQKLKSYPIPVPPRKEEQVAIADALSDADALIESLERLLAKKRQIKQGAMQELLTGKRRLPGFSDVWEVRKLGELSVMASGGTPPTSFAACYGGEIPWVSISDMTKGGKIIDTTDRALTALGFSMSAAKIFPMGTVLYAMYASLGECGIAGTDLSTSQAILGIRTGKALDPEFLYYWLTMQKSAVKALGQLGTQANLNKGMVEAFRLQVPSVPEQKAISSLLSDMDNELAALETKLTKARQIKQGMMQELLTGRIRLV